MNNISRNKIIAIVPARGGSKGIKNKNLSKLNGEPLIKWTLDVAKQSRCFSKIIVSSDDTKILNYCKEQDVLIHLRDKSISKDNTPIERVISDIVSTKIYTENNDYFMLLQPTSPLRKKVHILECVQKVLSEKMDSLTSITKEDSSSLKWFMMERNHFKPIVSYECLTKNRQELPQVFRPNGSIYLKRIDSFLKTNKLIDKETKFYEMENQYSIDIDDIEDLKKAEQMMRGKK